MPAYPHYRDSSGVEWLGAVPEHWEVGRLTDIADLINGFPFDAELFDPSDGIPLVRIRDLFEPVTTVKWSGDPVPEAGIGDGDVLIGMDGDFNVAWWEQGPALLNQRLCCIRALDSMASQRFLFYCLPFPLKALNDVTYATTVKHLSSLDVLKFRLPLPPLDEQHAIAAYLDRETERIDALVAKKRLLIERLEEYRTALITRTVTRGLPPEAARAAGLDPSPRLKPSGVEWLGEVPEHWEVARLKWSAVGTVNGVWGEEADGENDIACVRVADFDRRSFRVDFSDPTMRAVGASQRSGRELRPGDLLLEKSGGGEKQMVGCVVLYDHDEPAVSSNFVARILLADGADSGFWTYMHAALYSGKLNYPAIKQTTGIQNLDSNAYFNTPTPFPPLEEQRAIAAFLDRETQRVDSLTNEVESAIERLQEYRTALVTAAVTGKVDVRE